MFDRSATNPFDRSPANPFDRGAPEPVTDFPPLPPWLADRLLKPGEKITWVCGPRFNPSWERYVTHPALFLVALALGAFVVLAAWRLGGPRAEVIAPAAFAAGGIVLASIFVLAFFCGFFTRLVVTDQRLVILQGYETCRSWAIDDLPRSLLRYSPRGEAGEEDEGSRTVDLGALKSLLGTASDKVTDAKSILSLGKQLNQIRAREKGQP
jgi:hypothetical protein